MQKKSVLTLDFGGPWFHDQRDSGGVLAEEWFKREKRHLNCGIKMKI